MEICCWLMKERNYAVTLYHVCLSLIEQHIEKCLQAKGKEIRENIEAPPM
jgi:hypothetical protein